MLLEEEEDMSLDKIRASIVEGNVSATEVGVKAALHDGAKPDHILKEALIAAMDDVGAQFERGDLFVPEMLIAARAMKAGLSILKPYLAVQGVKPTGKVIIGTVKGDLHDIGKNLVAMMLEGAGFEVIDLGTDVPPERFAFAARDAGAQLLGISALLTTTMPNMKSTIEALEDIGLRKSVKVMIGGAPVTEDFAKQIGADA
jgi:5-methyltetrahydrofolate--homocysteine methyltransferase